MSFIVNKVEKVSVGTAAVSVEARCRSFLLVNTSDNATVYFRERGDDGKACTVNNGFALLPGQTTPVPMSASTLSLIATAVGTDVRVLFGREGC